MVLAARDNLAIGERRSECAALGVKAVPSDRRDAPRGLPETDRESGNVDILINNAGSPFLIHRGREIRRAPAMMDVNYFGTVNCTQAVLPQMLERRSGTIVT